MRQFFLLLLLMVPAFAQQSDAPVISWQFTKDFLSGNTFRPETGNLPAILPGEVRIFEDSGFSYLELNGSDNAMVLTDQISQAGLPQQSITVEALVRMRKNQTYSGIIGVFQDNGNFERGWVFGLDNNRYFIALAATAKKNMTYLYNPAQSEAGKWYHVAATYNGVELKLFVNGQQVAVSSEQQGNILYPEQAMMTIGAYRDENENFQMKGSLSYVRVYDRAINETVISKRAAAAEMFTSQPADIKVPGDFVVLPYLQQLTRTSVRILWETGSASQAKIYYGERVPLEKSVEVKSNHTFFEVELPGLKPNTNYFYKVVTANSSGLKTESEVFSFQTAPDQPRPIGFGFVSDTQDNPVVWGEIATRLFAERPDFIIHSGDIVDDGRHKDDWVDEFLKPGHELMSRVNLYAILGNHENDAEYYYQYISNPDPEYYYTFTWGNAAFFMVDSDRPLKKNSKQYVWLEKELAASSARWKFVAHHHPPYTSDEDDYGDTWKGPSRRGESDLDDLPALYEKYGVDMVFFGHIHDYERTWPILGGRVQDHGVVYLQGGGGGGGLENYAPTRSWFTAKVHRDHHFVMVTINGDVLQLQAIDWKGNLFDQTFIRKEN